MDYEIQSDNKKRSLTVHHLLYQPRAIVRGAAVAACLTCLTTVAYAELNDTGLLEYANEDGHGLKVNVAGYPGQDARYGRDAAVLKGAIKKTGSGSKGFDFTKLDAKGAPLPKNAKSWLCVRDNITGLIWELKTADQGLRDWRSNYSWYNPDPTTNGSFAGVKNAGTCTGGIDCDTHAYTEAVNALGLCGYSDWRLPERWELRSLVDYGKKVEYTEQVKFNDNDQSAIDTDYFPHTGAKWYWSASPAADHPEYAWRVFFYDGGDMTGIKEGGRVNHQFIHLRLVRGKASQTK